MKRKGSGTNTNNQGRRLEKLENKSNKSRRSRNDMAVIITQHKLDQSILKGKNDSSELEKYGL